MVKDINNVIEALSPLERKIIPFLSGDIEEIIENSRVLAIKNPMIVVKITCPIPVKRDTFPTSFMIFGFKCKPVINRIRTIPI